MGTRFRCFARRAATLVLCTVLWGPALARAQKTPAEHEAKAEFEAGVRASGAQDYEAAREHFMRSRQLVAKASTLLNLAITDLKLGLFDEALIALDAIDSPVPGPEQERLRQRARKMRGDIALLRESVAQARAQQQTEPGAPQPEAESLGPSPELGTAPAAAAPPAPPTAAPPEEAELGPDSAAERARTPTEAPSLRGARTVLALGGALALGALGSSLWWYDRRVDYRDCVRAQPTCPEKRTIDGERTAAAGVTIALGVASVGLIVSGAIWLVKRKEAHTNVSLTGDRRSLGLLARVRF